MVVFSSDFQIRVLLLIGFVNYGLCQKLQTTTPPSVASLEALEMEPVFITISPMHRTIRHGAVVVQKEIQLNWIPSSSNDSFDSVALYLSDPSMYNVKPEIVVKIADYPDNFYRTNISISGTQFPAGWENITEWSTPDPGEHCMPFWAGTLSNEVIQFLTCLKIRPSWMYDHRDTLGHLSILSLFIPGTHNSACYKNIDLSNIADIITENTITQDIDVWGQLVYGIRYIDLQTSYYSLKKKGRGSIDERNFYVNNDMIRIRPLLSVLQEIRKFLEVSQHEIIFLDFQRFPVGMKQNSHHKILIDLLEREFGDLAYHRPDFVLKVPTLDTMWKENKRLIIFYGEESRYTVDSPILWAPLHHYNGRKQTLLGLYNYLSDIMSRSEENTLTLGLWNVNAHLIPDPLAFFAHPEHVSIRSMAENSNRNISDWFFHLWWKNTSIMSTDFFLSTNIINMAVNTNVYKGMTFAKDQVPLIQYSQALDDLKNN